ALPIYEAVGVLEDVDDVLHGAGVGEGGGGELDDVGLLAAGVLLGGLLAPGGAVPEFLGGVPDDADDAAGPAGLVAADVALGVRPAQAAVRSEEHTSELQSRENLVCRLLLEKKKTEPGESRT